VLLDRARSMRAEPTQAERVLWGLLRGKRLADFKWKRQQPIGRYIVDFVCFEARLIVEANGSQHVDNDYDERRDTWLRSQGFRLLRLWNNDVLARPTQVADAVYAALNGEPDGSPTPLPGPPPQGGREQKDEPLA
jgi:very-short-patch-repair endonuclease